MTEHWPRGDRTHPERVQLFIGMARYLAETEQKRSDAGATCTGASGQPLAGTCREEDRGSNAGARQVASDLMHPIIKNRLWTFIGNDRTPCVHASGRISGASGHLLTARAIGR